MKNPIIESYERKMAERARLDSERRAYVNDLTGSVKDCVSTSTLPLMNDMFGTFDYGRLSNGERNQISTLVCGLNKYYETFRGRVPDNYVVQYFDRCAKDSKNENANVKRIMNLISLGLWNRLGRPNLEGLSLARHPITGFAVAGGGYNAHVSGEDAILESLRYHGRFNIAGLDALEEVDSTSRHISDGIFGSAEG